MTESSEERLLPDPDPVSQPFWDALHEHRLVLQKCGQCGAIRHYPRPVCDKCYSLEVEWADASGKGTVHSWTVSHHAFHISFKRDLPITLALVDLDEGVRLNCQLKGIDPEDIRIGMPVTVGFEDLTDDVTVPVAFPDM
tara:strand:+ start:235 stop:651 length:417 start_codon:yes stop_codon:yes gene_type:complete